MTTVTYAGVTYAGVTYAGVTYAGVTYAGGTYGRSWLKAGLVRLAYGQRGIGELQLVFDRLDT